MYCYSLSIPNAQIANPGWQKVSAGARIKRIEYSCNWDQNPLQRAEDVETLAAMQARGEVIVASIHIPFGGVWNPAQLYEPARRRAVELVKEFVEVTAPLGCKNYTFHPSAEPIAEGDRAASMEQSRKSMRELIPSAEKYGISFNMEDLPRTCLGRDLADMQAILADMPEACFGVCLDVNHFCGFAEQCPAIIRALGKRIRACHFSDYDGVDECHWYAGLGVLDWAAIMAELRKLPQKITIIFETYGFIKTPSWQGAGRDVNINTYCNAVKTAWYLEHAAEVESAVRGFDASKMF